MTASNRKASCPNQVSRTLALCHLSVQEVTERLSVAYEIRKSKKLSEWIQQKLQKGRSREISDYLRREKQRFFNSLVVAIYCGDPAWHGFSNFKPIAEDIDLTDVPEDVEDSVVSWHS